MSSDETAEMWATARTEVDEAIEFARTSAYPDPSSALDHVFA
jgi:TPP-dependent pyruvate/acetoin dehydrogenase alpha subunit